MVIVSVVVESRLVTSLVHVVHVVQIVQLVQVVLLSIGAVIAAVDEHTLLDGPGELVLNDAPLPCESAERDGCEWECE